MAVIMLLFSFIIVSLNLVATHHSYREAWDFLYTMANNGGFPVSSGGDLIDSHLFGGIDGDDSEEREEFANSYIGNRQDDYPFLFHERKASSLEPLLDYGDNKPLDYVLADNLEVSSAMSFRTDMNLDKVSLIFSSNALESLSKMFELCHSIAPLQKSKGILAGYFYVKKNMQDNTSIICIMNRFIELKSLRRLYFYSAIALAVSFLYSFATSFVFSKIIMQPIEDMFERQKQFISDSSHELRTPISVIDANLSVVMSEYPGNKWLGYIKDENARMGKLVKDMLYLTRSDQNLSELEKKEFDFSAAVTNAVLPFESVIYEARKHLEMNVAAGLRLSGDENAIKQVVTILVDNAVKYSADNGIIRVKAFHDGARCVLKVYNTGKGIKEENLDRIFGRFFREDKTRTGLKGGYGLGLPIARSIVEQHDGTIAADSDGETWVEFTVLLR